MNTRQMLRNAASNYGRLVLSLLTTVLLTPFILHRLGAEAFGLWALTQAVAGYFNLLDIGITNATARYLGHYRALQDWSGLNRIIGSSQYCYVWIASVVLLISLAVAFFADRLFQVTPGSLLTMRVLIVNVGIIGALGFANMLPIQCTIAAQRQDLLNSCMLVVQIFIAIFTAIGIAMGAGIVLLGVLQLVSAVSNGVIGNILSRRFLPQARFAAKWDREYGRMLLSFASLAILISIADRIIFFSDTLVISSVYSVAAVAGYAVALKMIEMMRTLVGSGVGVVAAFVQEQAALNNTESLSRIWWECTKWSLTLTIPLCAVFVFNGQALMEAWLGTGYNQAAAALAWLAFSQMIDRSQTGAYQIMMNTGRHKTVAVMFVCEAVANLSLSLWLIHPLGIVGVAVGTAIPVVILRVGVYPVCMFRITHLSVRSYLKKAVYPPIAAALPAVILSLLYRFQGWHQGKITLTALLTAIAILTAAGASRFCLDESQRQKIKKSVFRRFTRQNVEQSA